MVEHLSRAEEDLFVVEEHLGEVVDEASEVVEGFPPVVEIFGHGEEPWFVVLLSAGIVRLAVGDFLVGFDGGLMFPLVGFSGTVGGFLLGVVSREDTSEAVDDFLVAR